MIAVHLEAGRAAIRDVPVPARAPGFARIRLRIGGICNTDLELKRGYYGFIGTPGHEFVGEVVEAETRSLLGKRVVGEINLACGNCEWCARGQERHCPHRTVLGIVRHSGAFAEFLTLPERNLHVLPDELDDATAVFVEPVAAACRILEQVRFPAGAEVAVLGDGKLGLLIAQVLQTSGLRVQQFGRHREKLRIAERSGVTVEVSGDNLPRAAFEWVVDATGSAAGLRAACGMVRPLGTVILKSTVHGEAPLDTAPVIVNEITMIGSRCGRFEPAIELLRAGKIDVRSMVSDAMPLTDAAQAFGRAEQRGILKVLLTHP